MQTTWKTLCCSSLMGSSFFSRRLAANQFKNMMPLAYIQNQNRMTAYQMRGFAASSLEPKQQETQQVDAEAQRKKIGVDVTFSPQKHAYVLTFPWNFPKIIQNFEHGSVPNPAYWQRFLTNTNCLNEVNILFREFHQFCAIPDFEGIDRICEGQLADYVKQSVKRIHFHGLDIEMANLTVKQPSVRVIKAEVHHGISMERKKFPAKDKVSMQKSTFMGAPLTTYIPRTPFDRRSFLDHLDSEHKPYLVALTLLVESPMKLFVQNQNYSAILFGSNDEEHVKNVIKVEANVRWHDMFKLLPVDNKPIMGWKITDFNNVLNENPFYKDQ